MNSPTQRAEALAADLLQARRALRPRPQLNLIQWADEYRHVAPSTSATPGKWKTSAQPIAYGPMGAFDERDTHTISVMAGTQILKTELLLNIAAFYIHQEPSPILFIQPTQGAAEDFSKERFAPTIEETPALRNLVLPPRSRNSANTITHKEFPGGTLDFVGANSPTDLASRPKRIILADEIDKYPPSAGAEGDPLKLGEERASTWKALGRAKFFRTCSPTVESVSRIGREYAASDQRKCFIACPHCDHRQVLMWSHVRWDKDAAGQHLPDTAAIRCDSCGSIWSETDHLSALAALKDAPAFGWRQTRKFSCCGEMQVPSRWDDRGRAYCDQCGTAAPYSGHAGFHVSKLYSSRHLLSDIVREFIEAKSDPELLRKWTNTALAELWQDNISEGIDVDPISRAESYGGESLPDAVKVITGFCDVQNNRLEVQLVGWGADEESWPFLYEIIHQDPTQPMAWAELDELLRREFRTSGKRVLRVGAFGIDTGGHHRAQVFAFCRTRAKRRVFPTKGIAGPRQIWAGRAAKAKGTTETPWLIGVDAAKDAIYGRLKIPPPENGQSKAGYIHFPDDDNFGPEYFEQLMSERRETRRRMGQAYQVWVLPPGKRNEALDTLVGAFAVRRALPRRIEMWTEYSLPQGPPVVSMMLKPPQPSMRSDMQVGQMSDPYL